DNPYKLITSSTEIEGDSFVSLRSLHKSDYLACTLWANALDLALNVKDKFQVSFSLNFPNYANLTDIPEIITWLISKEARKNFMKGMNDQFQKQNSLVSSELELSFSELVSLTRATPAKLLGLGGIKGTLSSGTDADINILDINIEDVSLSKEYDKLKSALSNIEYVIKSGKIIKKKNKMDMTSNGLIFWSQGQVKSEEKNLVMSKKKEFYNKYSSIFYDSYQVSVNKNILRKID
ncbi:MAG: amidohydrolase family protein, partial [Promethearchaeota archaeon]